MNRHTIICLVLALLTHHNYLPHFEGANESARGRAQYVQTQCQLCSQSTEDKIMKNYHKPVGTGTVRKGSDRATRLTPCP